MFGKTHYDSLIARAVSAAGGAIEVHLDTADGPLLGKIKVAAGSEWNVLKAKLMNVPSGLHNLVVTQTETGSVDVDWISFE